MPFRGIESRVAMATIWACVDYKYEVIEILQKLSHSSRAYLWNANALPGFLVIKPDIIGILKRAHADGTIQEIETWHKINIDHLIAELQGRKII